MRFSAFIERVRTLVRADCPHRHRMYRTRVSRTGKRRAYRGIPKSVVRRCVIPRDQHRLGAIGGLAQHRDIRGNDWWA